MSAVLTHLFAVLPEAEILSWQYKYFTKQEAIVHCSYPAMTVLPLFSI